MAVKKHKCKYCGEYKESTIKTNTGRFCDFDHAIAFAKRKVKSDEQKASDDKFKERKKAFKLSDTTHQHKLTQKAFNKMRVLEEMVWFKRRGIEPYCISCGKTKMDWCCGHFKTVGSSGSLRYDEKNTYLQCNKYCNMSKSGNIEGCKNTHGYKKGLALRFGENKAKEIIKYCENHQADIKKWEGSELESLRKKFNARIRELQKQLKTK